MNETMNVLAAPFLIFSGHLAWAADLGSTVRLQTDLGDMTVRLEAQAAPNEVANFITLAKGGFYDGLTFYRRVPGLLIETGDPLGTGDGGPGFCLPRNEGDLAHDGPGRLAMSRVGAFSHGSRFYITLAKVPLFDGDNTVFGTVVEGLETLRQLAAAPPTKGASGAPHRLIKVDVGSVESAMIPQRIVEWTGDPLEALVRGPLDKALAGIATAFDFGAVKKITRLGTTARCVEARADFAVTFAKGAVVRAIIQGKTDGKRADGAKKDGPSFRVERFQIAPDAGG